MSATRFIFFPGATFLARMCARWSGIQISPDSRICFTSAQMQLVAVMSMIVGVRPVNLAPRLLMYRYCYIFTFTRNETYLVDGGTGCCFPLHVVSLNCIL